MFALFILIALIGGPVLAAYGVGRVAPSIPFRLATVFKLYLSLLFGGFGFFAHILHPEWVVALIPDFFPMRVLSSYASGVLELAFAVLIWTRFARPTGVVIIAYLALVLPFNIYGWTIPANMPSYVNAPYYLWLRVPLQAVFMAFAWFGTRPTRR